MNRFSVVASIALTLLACFGGAQVIPNETARATFRVNFDRWCGPFVIEVTSEQAPNGAESFVSPGQNGK